MRQTDHNTLRRELAENWVKTQPVIESYVLSAVPSFQDAEDIIQATAQEVAAHYENYDPARPFTPWAMQIAKAQIAQYYQRRNRQHPVLDTQILDELAGLHANRDHNHAEESEALARCLAKLKHKARELLRLRYESDMKPARIAEMFNTSAGSIRVTLRRIRGALADCIQQRLTGQNDPSGEPGR